MEISTPTGLVSLHIFQEPVLLSNPDMSHKQALQAYRAALRATRVAFNGDSVVLNSARNKIREGFEENRSMSDQQEIEKAVTDLNEVAKFLVKNIVQGEQEKDGRYFLKFHDKTELGSNESIKQNNRANMGSLAGVKVKKCTDK